MAVAPRLLAASVALALGLGGALVVASPAAAAADSFDVDNPSGDVLVSGSLPWAVSQAEADAGHTDITILPAAGPSITLLTNLVISTDVTITGLGSSALSVVGSATPADPVFYLSGAGPIEITGMTIAPGTAGTVHGIESYADSLTIHDLSLDGFSDDNFRIDAGSLAATDIVTTNSNNDGFSYVNFGGGTTSVSNITATGNGDYGIILGNGSGTLDASDLTADGNGSGIYVLAFSADAALSNSVARNNAAEGVRLIASSATATFSDITSTGNGIDPCLCGGPGMVVRADGGSVVDVNRANLSGNTATIGAGIYLELVSGGSTVAIGNSTVSGNHAIDGGNGLGGGIAASALYDASSSISLTDTVISGNDAEAAGGGVYLADLGVGAPTGGVTIARTTIDGNSASYGAGLLLGGSSGTTLTIQDSTISANTAREEGGGLYLYQDPANAAATVLLTGSTVSGNRALGTTSSGNGGAIYVASAGAGALLDVRLEYSTIAANDPPGVGGVFVDGDGVALSLLSSILAGNERGDLSFPATIASFSAEWSLVQDAALAGIPLGATNVIGADPKLGPLADNGGATKSMLVAPGSAAFNAGDPAFAGAGLLDQRGQARVYQVIDIGAVEWHPALALTGVSLTPEPPLVALLLLFTGLAMVASSRLRESRSVG